MPNKNRILYTAVGDSEGTDGFFRPEEYLQYVLNVLNGGFEHYRSLVYEDQIYSELKSMYLKTLGALSEMERTGETDSVFYKKMQPLIAEIRTDLESTVKAGDEISSKFQIIECEEDPDAAKHLFRIMKEHHLARMIKHDGEEFGKQIITKNLVENLSGDKGILHDLEELLKSGDCVWRGSSDAYKEIQKEVKDLNTFLTRQNPIAEKPMAKRFTEVMLRSIAERAESYITDRRDVALNSDPASYKGTRVMVMSKLCNRIKIYLDACEKAKVLANPDDKGISDAYKKRIEWKLATGTFNKTLAAESMALKNCTTVGAVKNEAKKFLESPDMQIMAKGLKGETFNGSTIRKYWNTVTKNMENCRKIAGNAVKAVDGKALMPRLQETTELISQINGETVMDEYVKHTENVLFDDKTSYLGKMTGNFKLDRLLLKNMHKSLLDAAKAINENAIFGQVSNFDVMKADEAANLLAC